MIGARLARKRALLDQLIFLFADRMKDDLMDAETSNCSTYSPPPPCIDDTLRTLSRNSNCKSIVSIKNRSSCQSAVSSGYSDSDSSGTSCDSTSASITSRNLNFDMKVETELYQASQHLKVQ